MTVRFLTLCALVCIGAMQAAAGHVEIYVAPTGSDAWTGRLREAAANGADGPLATLDAARDAVRAIRAAQPGVAVTVNVLEGVYPRSGPFVLGTEDSGTPAAPVVYRSWPGNAAPPTVSGGRRIEGWRREGALWVADVPAGPEGPWHFSSLWVNGRRCTVARTPNTGYQYMRSPYAPRGYWADNRESVGNEGFQFYDGDIRHWNNIEDAWIVVYHSWETSSHRIKQIDDARSYVEFTVPAFWAMDILGASQRYHVENVLEALDAPGEWYLDRAENRVYYLPRDGEDMAAAEIVAPVARQLVVMQGDAASGRFIEHVAISGLRFSYTGYEIGPERAQDTQAAHTVPGAIHARLARYCAVEQCEVVHVGTYGIHLGAGCQDNRIVQCEVHDTGAGGIRIGPELNPATSVPVERNLADNNFIHDGGKILPSGVGIWIGQAAYNVVSHNEVCDLYYSGVSVGWSWGYGAHAAHHNLIEYNHIHDIGRGVMNDMGGIYTLGVQPGTVLHHNRIHDITCYLFGGFGIYLDEGSSGILVENNVVYDTQSGGFVQHYGRDDRVRNNIFALAEREQVLQGREEDHLSVVFDHNIVVTSNGKVFGNPWSPERHIADGNCYWDVNGVPLTFVTETFEEWQAKGFDRNSICADPLFENLPGRDFALRENSPALSIGFTPIDIRSAGLYGGPEWVNAPKAIRREPVVVPVPPDPPPTPFREDFESTPAGAPPPGARRWGITELAHIQVTDERARTGNHSVKFTDNDPALAPYDPEFAYSAYIKEGVAATSFDLYLTPGAALRHDQRGRNNIDSMGPNFMISGHGDLAVAGDVVVRLPHNEWVHLAIEWPVGPNNVGTFALAVTRADGSAERFADLPCVDKDCDILSRAFFLSFSAPDAPFYVDNLSIEQR